MALDESYRPLLAYWIRQQKDAERDLQRHRDDVQRWFKRAKLAADKGEIELAAIARDQFDQSRQAFQKAEARIMVIQHEREMVRQAAQTTTAMFRDASRRTNHALEEFAKLGIDPNFALLEQQVATGGLPAAPPPPLDEREVLRRLEARMRADATPATSASPSAVAPPAAAAEDDDTWSLEEAERLLAETAPEDPATPRSGTPR